MKRMKRQFLHEKKYKNGCIDYNGHTIFYPDNDGWIYF